MDILILTKSRRSYFPKIKTKTFCSFPFFQATPAKPSGPEELERCGSLAAMIQTEHDKAWTGGRAFRKFGQGIPTLLFLPYLFILRKMVFLELEVFFFTSSTVMTNWMVFFKTNLWKRWLVFHSFLFHLEETPAAHEGWEQVKLRMEQLQVAKQKLEDRGFGGLGTWLKLGGLGFNTQEAKSKEDAFCVLRSRASVLFLYIIIFLGQFFFRRYEEFGIFSVAKGGFVYCFDSFLHSLNHLFFAKNPLLSEKLVTWSDKQAHNSRSLVWQKDYVCHWLLPNSPKRFCSISLMFFLGLPAARSKKRLPRSRVEDG